VSRIAEAREAIAGEWSSLESLWEETRHDWRDAAAERFEREFWNELEGTVPQLLKAMDDLNDTLDQALRNTET
jgi:uncharacterized protein YukE